MKKIMNERGYALVTVLLVIVIFMMLAFSFMGQATSSIKQNSVIEDNSQSVALAEMGIVYYEHAIRNVYETNHQKVIDEVKAEQQNDIQKNIPHPDDYYRQRAILKMETILKNKLNSITKTFEDNPSASFTSSGTISKITNGLRIEFSSTGAAENKQTTITAALIIDFTEWVKRDEDEGGSNETGKPLPTGNEIKDPGKLSSCSKNNKKEDFTGSTCQIDGSVSYRNNDQLTFENSTFKVDGALTIGNMNKDIVNSTLYITGSMQTENMNSLTKLRLHVSGSSVFGHFNGQGLTDSMIEIGGSATMQNIKLTRSQMFIGGAASIGQINDMVDSYIFVNSDATITGVNFGNNSTICINGTLSIGNINNNSNNTSKIYAKATNPRNKNGVITITNPAEFKNVCGRNTGGESPISWGDSTITTEYDYQY